MCVILEETIENETKRHGLEDMLVQCPVLNKMLSDLCH